jgi:amino acid adenylation domain-containing protein/non-ribosomal peptide synthase protein (TIGR01720 family)
MSEAQSIVGFRLSPQQERLWRLAGEGGLSPYRSRCAVIVAADLDAARLRSALDRVAELHEILRSRFQVFPGMALPLQVVGEGCRIDFAAATVPDGSEELERLALIAFEEMGGLPFDPVEGPVLRVRLLSQTPARHALVVAASALHLDGLGLRNLLLDLGRCLAVPAPQEGDGLQYADLAEWQHDLLASESGAGVDFWRAQAETPVAPGQLPWELSKAGGAGYAPVARPFALAPDLTARASAVAGEHGVDLSDVLLAVWQVLLSRLTGSRESRIAIASDGRSYEGLEEQLGLFARYLPVDSRWEPAASFAQIVKRVHRAVAQARGWQEYFDWGRLTTASGEIPFLPVGFDFQEAWVSGDPAFPWRLLRASAGLDRFTVRLSCLRAGDRIHGELFYDILRIDDAEAGFLIERFQTLLAAAIADPGKALEGAPLVGRNEHEWLLADLNRTGHDGPEAVRCLHDLIREQALRTPERTAMVGPEGEMTYAELLSRSCRLANRLRRLGVGPEVRVGVWAERSLDLVVALLGVWTAGGAYVPLDPNYPRERRDFVLAASEAALLLVPTWHAAGLDTVAVPVLSVDSGLEEESPELTAAGAVPANLAYAIFTSGSTGRPKGVMVSHGAIANRLLWMQRALPLGEGDVVLQKTPAVFDASIWELFVPLLAGARLVVAPPEAHRDSAQIADLVEQHGVTVLQLVPSQLRLVLDEPGLARCHTLRRVFAGGEALAADLRERFAARLDAELVNLYGPTECAIDVTCYPCPPVVYEEGTPSGPVTPIGRPIDNMRAYVLDREQQPVPAGIAGELCAAGAGLARGYCGRPEATAEAFIPDPFSGEPGARMYRTGDLVRHLPGGVLSFLGRIDHQVKVRGFRIELGEIEALLAAHPSVAEAAVVARELAPGDVQLVGWLVARPAEEIATADLRSYLAERLPEHMLPAFLLPLPALPRLPSGKVDRAGLAATDPVEADTEETDAAPVLSPVEEILAGIFATLLRRDRVAQDDSFFDLGGHSLLATQVVARLREALHVELPMRTLFDHPTLGGLAREIEHLRTGGGGRELPPILPVPRQGDLPLSFAQQRLWLVQQLAPGTVAYNLPFLVELPRAVDLGLLAQVLERVVARHEALRTTFPVRAGRPVQRVGPVPPGGGLVILDLRPLSPELVAAEVERLAEAEARRPFDLAHGPLFRATALAGGERSYALFSLHHIASDAWSVGILLRELEVFYSAAVRSAAPPLPELPVQYGDYAVWQRAWLESPLAAAQLDHWRQRLAGAPRLLELPLDRPRPETPSARGANRTVLVPAEIAGGVKALARHRGVTLFMAVLAAWDSVLHRLSGQSDLVVGAPTAGRTSAEIEGLIGVFINVLPLRAAVEGRLPVADLLERIKSTTLDAFSHQDLPFERLVQELEPERTARHSPIFQVLFALQNAPVGRLRLAGETLDVRPLTTGEVQFDLILAVTETAAGMFSQLGYSSELFDEATVVRIEAQLLAALAALAGGTAERCEDLTVLPESERSQLLAWERAEAAEAVDGGEGPWAHELFAAQAARHPHRTAVVWGAERLTYGELAGLARGIARRLREEGAGPEIPVGVLLERSPLLVASLLGIWQAGAVYVPLDPGLPAERLRMMLDEGRVRLVLTDAALAPALPETAQALLVEGWKGEPGQERVPAALSGDSLAYLIFTSGTTGRPKAVMVEHGNLAHTLSAGQARFSLGPEDVMLHLAPFSFDISLFELLMPLTSGGSVVVLRRDEILDMPRLAATLAGATRLHAVPSLMRQLVQHLRDSGERPRGLRTAFTGGDSVPAELLRDMREVFPAAAAVVLYGPTEAAIICTCWPVPGQGAIAPGVIGRPLSGVSLRIVDASGDPVPIGVAGELWLAGGGVTRGYQGRPDLTADKYRPAAGGARSYRTGDRVRFLAAADGEIEFLGRIDHQVKVRGYRVEPGDVEAALALHPAVTAAAVVARPVAKGSRDLQLVAYAVAREELSTADLRRFAEEKLPAYMIPAAFVLLPALPRNPSGKLDRKALPEPGPAQAPGRAYTAPRIAREEVLAEIWARTLGLGRVGVHDNFFALGGDSILCIQIVARANQQGFRLTPRDLFQHQTVAELAAVSSAADSMAAQGPVTGEAPLTPVQRRFFEQCPVEPHHFNQAALLAVREAPVPAHLAAAVEHLVHHHDALRLRFARENGSWRQHHAEPASAGKAFACVDLAALPPGRLRDTIAAAAEQAQAGFDLARGPLLRAVLFLTAPGEPARLLLAIHHLVVDGVSWRLLLDDLERTYGQLARGEAVALPAKTGSFKQWAEHLVVAAHSPGVRAELGFWLAPSRARLLPLPVDLRGANTVGAAETVLVTLGTEETRQLLRDAQRPYRTRVDHLLLAAVAHAFAAWMRGPALLVDLESHGREEIAPGLDLSATVGWLTSIYPVLLEAPAAGDWAALIKSVKEQVQRVPRLGIGYGLLRYLCTDADVAEALGRQRSAEVSFNYLGQLDRILAPGSPFLPAPEPAGAAQSGRQTRSYLIDITASVAGERLQVAWTFGAAVHRRETVERLAGAFLDALRGLLAHCLEPGAGGYTPSDFPLARLDQAALDRLVPPGEEIDDIYPQSPLQQGLFFHALLAPRSGDYIVQRSSTLAGDLDVAALKLAWATLLARHPVLRTSFASEGLKVPVQRVHRRVALPWHEEDWRFLSEPEQRERLAGFLAAERRRGFDPGEAPLLRVALFRLGESTFEFVWCAHHLLLDGWSMSLLFAELFAVYRELRAGGEPEAAPVLPYRDYIDWIERQDRAECEAYWRQALTGLARPTLIAASGAAGEGEGQGTVGLALSEEASAELNAFAQRHPITLSTVMQGALALLLAHQTRSDDVVFGLTLAGRPAELSHVEHRIGLFSNTLPVRVRIQPGQPVLAWLQRLQEGRLESSRFEYSPLVDVQAWSGLGSGAAAGAPLFDTILTYQNFPLDSSAGGERGLGIDILRAEEMAQNSNPLTILAVPGRRFALRALYDRRTASAAGVEVLLQQLAILLRGIAEQPDGRIETLQALLGEHAREREATQAKAFNDAIRGRLRKRVERPGSQD